MALNQFLDCLTLDESAKYRMDFLAVSNNQVEDWLENMLKQEGIHIFYRSWDAEYGFAMTGKSSVKHRLNIKCSGQIDKWNMDLYLDRLTAILNGPKGRECYSFYVSRANVSCYDGVWCSELDITSHRKFLPKRWKDRA